MEELKIKIHMSRSDQSQIYTDGTEIKQASVTFAFDPTLVECVKSKAGDYIIREKK